MPIVSCPQCQARLRINDSNEPKRVGCPRCKTQFTPDRAHKPRSDDPNDCVHPPDAFRFNLDDAEEATPRSRVDAKRTAPRKNHALLIPVLAGVFFLVAVGGGVAAWFMTRAQERTADARQDGSRPANTKQPEKTSDSKLTDEKPKGDAPKPPTASAPSPKSTKEEGNPLPAPASESAPFAYPPIDLHGKFVIADWREGTAFAAAYDHHVGDADIPGKPDEEAVTKMARNLAAGAARSPTGNLLGATLRIAETKSFRPNSEAEALSSAISSGSTIYTHRGKKTYTTLSPSEWTQVISDSGVESTIRTAFRGQTAANERFVLEKRLDVIVRLHQARVDLVPRIRLCYRAAMLRDLPPELRPKIDELAQRVAVSLLTTIKPSKIHDPDAVVDVLTAVLEELNVDKRRIDTKALRIVAADGYAQLEQHVRNIPTLVGYRSAAGLILMHHKLILTRALEECQ